MKKTLITLLTGTGCVFGTELTMDNVTAYVNGHNWEVEGMDYTLNADNDIVFTAEEFAALNGSYNVTTIVLTLDLSKITIPTEASQLLTIDGSKHDTGLGISADGKISASWDSSYAYYTSFAPDQEGWVTLVYTLSKSGTRIHKNDEKTYWSNTSLKGDIGTNTTLTLEKWAVDGLIGLTVFSGQDSYNDAEMVKSAISLHKALPEPTTATLSLLALAGLAARRRRR